MKKILLSGIVICLIIISSCKKETGFKNVEDASELKGNYLELFQVKKAATFYQASTKELAEGKARFREKALREWNSTTSRPGPCSELQKAEAQVYSMERVPGGGCGGSHTMYVTYHWYVLEWTGYAYPANYDFDVTGSQGVYTPISTPSEILPSTFLCPPGLSDCFLERTFVVTVIMDEVEIMMGSPNHTVYATCTAPGSLTFSESNTASLAIPSNFYTSTPARVFVTPFSATQVLIGSQDCGGLCYPPFYVNCPSSAVFEYRLGTSGSWIPFSFVNSGNVLTLSTPGTYYWRCTLTYSGIGNSQQATGSFTL